MVLIMKIIIISMMMMKKTVIMRVINNISNSNKNKSIKLTIKIPIIKIILRNAFNSSSYSNNLVKMLVSSRLKCNSSNINLKSNNSNYKITIIITIHQASLWIQMVLKDKAKRMERDKVLLLLLSRSEKILKRKLEFSKSF